MPDVVCAKIGERIRDRRVEIGVPVETLADVIGVSRATMYRYEAKQYADLPISAIAPIAKALHVTVQYLLGIPDDAEFSDRYRKTLKGLLSSANEDDLNDSNIKISELNGIIDGSIKLTLDLACDVADQLGESLDFMLGHNPEESIKAALSEEDGLVAEIIRLVYQLPDEKKPQALDYLRFLLSQSKSPEA